MVQEQEMQRRQLMARYQNASPAEQAIIKQQLLAQRHQQQQNLQQQQMQMAGMPGAQPGMAAYDAQVLCSYSLSQWMGLALTARQIYGKNYVLPSLITW